MRGKVSDADLAIVRNASFTDSQIIEIIALAAQFLLTNFVNNVAQTDIDFPSLKPVEPAPAYEKSRAHNVEFE